MHLQRRREQTLETIRSVLNTVEQLFTGKEAVWSASTAAAAIRMIAIEVELCEKKTFEKGSSFGK